MRLTPIRRQRLGLLQDLLHRRIPHSRIQSGENHSEKRVQRERPYRTGVCIGTPAPDQAADAA